MSAGSSIPAISLSPASRLPAPAPESAIPEETLHTTSRLSQAVATLAENALAFAFPGGVTSRPAVDGKRNFVVEGNSAAAGVP